LIRLLGVAALVSALPQQPSAALDADADSTQRQAEASVEQVEADLKRLGTFSVRRQPAGRPSLFSGRLSLSSESLV